MSVAMVTKRITPTDLLAMPDANMFEIVDGELVERNASVLSSWVENRTSKLISVYADDHGSGQVWNSSMGIKCFPDNPDRIRRPDVSFVRAERFHERLFAAGFLTIAPDLAVEVVSPGDLAEEVEQKVTEYLGAGVRLIWIIYPETRTVHVIRPDGSSDHLQEASDLTGEDILSGFRCKVADLFPVVKLKS